MILGNVYGDHFCDPPHGRGPYHDLCPDPPFRFGTIWECDHCHRLWCLKSYGTSGGRWTPVRRRKRALRALKKSGDSK